LRSDVRHPGSRRSAQGFTLLEIIVAFTLMALIITVLLRIFSGGLQGISLAEDYARATSIAESAMARVGADIELKAGVTSGEVDDRYRWNVELRPYQPPQDFLPGVAPNQQPFTLPVVMWEVVVQVVWSEYGKDRNVVLSTLRVGPRS
jgi:general secretion pathway protein I